MTAPVLFTIGYEKQVPEEFIGKLRQNGIGVLIDVRENPASRKPGFSKKNLAARLEPEGIRYVHVKELGAPRPLRDRVRSDGDYDAFLLGYGTLLSGKAGLLEELYANLVSRERCCLMCLEKDPAMCHRSAVAQRMRDMAERSLEVIHI